MALSTEQKSGVVAQYRRDPKDTGSPEVQTALPSERINGLGDHFSTHKKDHSSRRGLVKLVNQRRKLLDYSQGDDTRQISGSGWAPGAPPLIPSQGRGPRTGCAAFYYLPLTISPRIEACPLSRRDFPDGPHTVTLRPERPCQANGAAVLVSMGPHRRAGHHHRCPKDCPSRP